MDLGDRPPSTIFATSGFSTALLILDRGISPIFGLIQLLRQPSHSSNVESATGLRLRFWTWLNHCFACSRKVIPPPFFLTTFWKYFSVSAPLAATISRARRCRSDLDRRPGSEIGQILSRMCLLSLAPAHPSTI